MLLVGQSLERIFELRTLRVCRDMPLRVDRPRVWDPCVPRATGRQAGLGAHTRSHRGQEGAARRGQDEEYAASAVGSVRSARDQTSVLTLAGNSRAVADHARVQVRRPRGVRSGLQDQRLVPRRERRLLLDAAEWGIC